MEQITFDGEVVIVTGGGRGLGRAYCLELGRRGAFVVVNDSDAQSAWRVMKRNGYGRVVLTSSAAGLFSRAGSVNYSAAKAGLYGMARALSFEGAGHGIKVNVLLPRAAATITADDPVPGMSDARYSDELTSALAPRRSPRSTAALACWLASRACTVHHSGRQLRRG